MKTVLAVLMSLSVLQAQTPAPPASPAASETAPKQDQFRSGTTGIVLDVVVRDRRGRPVRDLQQAEITVVEDGVSRDIKIFRLVERAENRAPASEHPAAADGKPDPLRLPTLITLVFDHLTQNARSLARKAALQFVSRAIPEDQWVAVFSLEQRLRLEQAFTRDPDALRRAIERATLGASETRDRAPSSHSDRDAAQRSAEAALGTLEAERPTPDTSNIGASIADARIREVLARVARMVETADLQQRGQATLFPLMALMKAQGSLTGRKALVLFSEGLAIPPNLEEAYRSTISEANRANVSIYAVDARGLDTGRALEQSRQMLERSARNSQSQVSAGSSQRPVTMDDVMNSETAEGALRTDTQSVLRALAEETSGILIGNTNDLGNGLVHVASDLDSYYEIGYTPAAAPPDGRFHTIQVKIARRGVVVQSRSGYFALPETDTAPLMPYELPMLSAAAADTPPRAFDYSAKVFRFDHSPKGVQHTLLVEIPLERLTFQEDRRSRTYALRFTAMALIKDASGQVVQRFSETYPLEGPVDRLPALKRGRLRFKRQFSVAPGHYTLVTVARDQATERSSVQSLPLDVPDATPGIRLSDLSIIRSVQQTGDAPDSIEDPFRTGAIRVAPNLYLSISKTENAQLSAYVIVYPASAGGTPALTFEFIRDGAVIGRSAAELPAPDDSGSIKYVATFPTQTFGPGKYDLRAVATQGGKSVSAQTAFVLVE